MTRIFYAEVPDFYAEAERIEQPELADRPIVVGGDPKKGGKVQSADPAARSAGVEAGMRMRDALARCPQAAALRTDMKRYRRVCDRLRQCLWADVTQLENAELGSFYFRDTDIVAQSRGPVVSVVEFGQRLQERVRESLGLRIRLGAAPAKFLARLAAEESGSAGVREVRPGEESDFLEPLPIERLPGVGPKTRERLERELAIRTAGELSRAADDVLDEALGNHGLRLRDYARGEDASPVRATPHPQSFSCETGLGESLDDPERLREDLRALARELEDKLETQGLRAGRVSVKLHFVDTGSESRSQTLGRHVISSDAIYRVALRLLERTQLELRSARRLGVSVSKLELEGARDRQLELFPEPD